MILHSCKDDPLSPVQDDFDPPRFNWRTVEIPRRFGFADIWAMDTSRIFLLNHDNRSLYIYSGGRTDVYNVGNYYLNEIKGLSNSEVYIFGTQIGGNMTIIKWNGAGFEYYSTTIHVFGSGVYYVRGGVVSSNEVWIASQDGISMFDGVSMTNYFYEDSLMIPNFIFRSIDNKIQYIAERWADTSYIQESLFEFRDTGFVRVFNYIGDPFPHGSYTFLVQVGGFKLGLKLYDRPKYSVCVENFTGTSFSPYFCYPKIINSTYRSVSPATGFVGSSPQNLMLVVQASDIIFDPPVGPDSTIRQTVGLVHWNGNRVSKEMGLLNYESPSDYDAFILHCINSDSYLVLTPYGYEINSESQLLHIGTKRQ